MSLKTENTIQRKRSRTDGAAAGVFGRCGTGKVIADSVLDWIYPRRCPVCDGILGKKEPYICRNCARKLKPVEEPRCWKCSKSIHSWTEEYCTECGKGRHFYDRGFAVYPYHGPIQGSLMRFKYSGRQEYAGFYARAIAVYGGRMIRRTKAEVLVPVPIHRKKLRTRGYNQAEVLARCLAKETGLPVDSSLVLRKKNTLPQKELSPEERRKNLREAFCLRHPEKKIPYRRILLVDDIYTTGSTVDALAALFRQAGVEAIFFVTVAIGNN